MSSSISATDPSLQSLQTAQVAPKHHGHHHHGHGGKAVMDSVSKALGMSDDDVQSALKNGTSLTDLAKQKGVSQETLVGAIKDGITAAGNGQAPTGARLDQIAQSIADRVPGGQQQQADGTQPVAAKGSVLDVTV